MIGQWQGPTRTWFEPGKLEDESEWRGSIEPLLDGRFLIHRYTGTLLGQPLQGEAIFGFNSARNQFECTWIDSFHMGDGMLFSTGHALPDGFSVTGQYAAGEGQPDWGWRTEVRLLSNDELLMAAYNISPEGEEALGVETRYRRT